MFFKALTKTSFETLNLPNTFEVSKDVYGKCVKQHAFDPLLSNKATDYYHEILYLKQYKAKVEVLHKLISIFLQCLDMH